MSEFKSAVGISRNWDARKAGREVSRKTIEKLGKDPDLFLVFCTIHHRESGGMKEFLRGVKEILPRKTPIIGGSVTGFVTKKGTYIRGSCALGISYDKMDVVIGKGGGTKRNPKKAAKNCSNTIIKGMKDSKYKNKFLVSFVSGSLAFKIPGRGYVKTIKSKALSNIIKKSMGISNVMQIGPGREGEIFEEIVKKMPEYKILLGTSIGGFEGETNYQFFNGKVLTNSVVSAAISTDIDFDAATTHGMKKTEKVFEITKVTKDGHIIEEINNKPALKELYRIMKWPKDFINEKNMYEKILYYPISAKIHDREVPIVMPLFLKDSIVTPCKVEKGIASVMNTSGKNLLEAVEKNLSNFKKIEPELGLSTICVTIYQALGSNGSKEIRKKMTNYFKEKPFLGIICAGEGTYTPERFITYANMSYNTAVFGRKKQLL